MTPNWEDFMKQVRHEWMQIRMRQPDGPNSLSCHFHEGFPLQVAVELIHKQGVELQRLHLEVESLRQVIMEKDQ